MSNDDVGDVLFEVAELIEIQNGNRYRANAFRKAGRLISALREPVAELLKFGRLQQKPGIGSGTVERVKAILRTGTFDELERLRAQTPPGLRQLIQLKGIGPRTAKAIWQQLRISTVPELEQALLTGRLDVISGIGPKTKERIVDAIRFSREDMGRILLPEALAIGQRMVEELKTLSATLRIQQCGSARRRKATIGDLDILVGADDKRAVATRFCMLPGVVDVLLRGDGRCSVRLDKAVQVDLRVVEPETFGAGLHYFTGSQQHNIRVRTRANAKGWSLSEHGIFVRAPGRRSAGGGGASDQRVAFCRDEDEIFRAVGLMPVPPELRENEGEIEAAEKGRLPALVQERELAGDLHVRAGPALLSTLLALKARGRKWAVVVHRRVPAGAAMAAVTRDIERKARESGLHLALGVEVPIAPDGSVPPRPEGVDWVVAQIPEPDVVPGNDVTERLLAAIESDRIDALARPTGRMLLAHKGHRLDWERVLRVLSRHKVVLQVRGHPIGLDPDAATIRRALELGVRLSLTAAPESPAALENQSSALYEARRGWATARQVLECWRLEDALGFRRDRGATSASASGTSEGQHALNEEVIAALSSTMAEQELAERARAFVAGAIDPALERALKEANADEPPLSTAFLLASLSAPAAEADEDAGAPVESAPGQTAAIRRSILDDFDAPDADDDVEKDAEDVGALPANGKRSGPEPEAHLTAASSPTMDAADASLGEREQEALSAAETKALVDAAVASDAPVDDRLRGALDAYLRGEDDAEMDAALRAHSDNPLQLAFALVVRGGGP